MRSVDLCVLEAEIQFLSNHMLIANFIGPKPKFGILEPWMEALNSKIRNGHVSFNHEACFFYLKCNSPETMKQILMQTLFRNGLGMSVFHPWVLASDASNLSRSQLPTWITIKKLPLEHMQLAHLVTAKVDVILGCDPENVTLRNPRFCVSVNVERGWTIKAELIAFTPTTFSQAIIDDDSLPIRCCYCLSMKHLIRSCQEIPSKRFESGTYARPQHGSGLGHYTLGDASQRHSRPKLLVLVQHFSKISQLLLNREARSLHSLALMLWRSEL